MDFQKEINLNKRILIVLIMLCVLTMGMYSSYALFEKKETYDNVLKIQTANSFPKAIEVLKAKAGTTEDELQAIDTSTGLLCPNLGNCNIREYRYSGPSVNNYVKLKNINPETGGEEEELWRIIGIFKDEENQEEYLRIVRDEVLQPSYIPFNYTYEGITYKILFTESLTDVYWNNGGSNNNDFATAGIQYYLNTDQDDTGSNKGYMSYLSEDTKDLLSERVHYLGAVSTTSNLVDTPISAYKHERDIKNCPNNRGTVTSNSDFPLTGCNVWDGNHSIWEGKISLMYASDYGYSVDSQYWTTWMLKKSSEPEAVTFYDSQINGTSWMYITMPDAKTKFSWFISPSNYDYTYITGKARPGNMSTGVVNQDHITSDRSVIPVLNLKTDVKISNIGMALGTKEKPYELSI